jgi:hypothetical protein
MIRSRNLLGLVLVIGITMVSDASLALGKDARKVPAKPPSGVHSVSLKAPLDPGTTNWVEKELVAGRTVVLSNPYLFQVMKAACQERQKQTEETVLIPVLRQTLEGVAKASDDTNARRIFAVALALLAPKTNLPFTDQERKEADAVKTNPLFKPRGHYTDSEELQAYFVAMQYLSKVTIDVSINPERFPFPPEMLFPFETTVAVIRTLTDPKNEKLLAQWKSIHVFYSGVNGPADAPTCIDMVEHFKAAEFDKTSVEKWCQEKGIPKINAERGIGIQPFGERFSVHEQVIDAFKAKIFNDGTAPDEINRALAFPNLMRGIKDPKRPIKGFAASIAEDKGDSYSSLVLKAIVTGAQGWQRNSMRLNFFAASLTSLAEQTALMTKDSVLIQKSYNADSNIPDKLKLFFEPGSEKYLLGLAEACAAMEKLCGETQQMLPRENQESAPTANASDAFRAFAALAKTGKPLVTGTALWKAHGRWVIVLARKPAVTVDVFQLKDRTGKLHFYQWAVAPFESVHGDGPSRPPEKGLDMVFFEGWGDTIVPGADGPLDNEQWESRVRKGGLNQLKALVSVPRQGRR